ncbi:MAG: hypothetical protein HY858_11105 [Candidatus Solibacter usitatus]|nr:hypothetical protein [Candidatus Solibacter usitatus]
MTGRTADLNQPGLVKWDAHIKGRRFEAVSKEQPEIFRPLFERMLNNAAEMSPAASAAGDRNVETAAPARTVIPLDDFRDS